MSAKPRSRKPALLLLAVAVTAALAGPARAIDIVLVFESGKTETYIDPYGQDRTTDLIPIMEAAAGHWEDIIQDAHTLTIHYWWEDLAGALAYHTNWVIVGGREVEANIHVDTKNDNGDPHLFFFDPTPTDDSEFNMGQTLYRDLTLTQQGDWTNGSPPEVFEMGCGGLAKPTAPADAQSGIDLVALACHELGHDMGMIHAVCDGETLPDNDYDVSGSFVHGSTMAVVCYAPDNRGHLAAEVTLMYPSGGPGYRKRPAAADVMAMAAASNWVDLDLRRQDFLGGTDWNDGYNWLGGSVPDADDDAYIRLQAAPAIVALSANGEARKVSLAHGNWLSTGAYKLDVGDITYIDGANTQIFVPSGGELETTHLSMWFDGELDLSGGLADVDHTLGIHAGCLITGHGTIDVAWELYNNGTLRPEGGTLTLTTAGTGVWDLDGQFENGQLDCSDGDLAVHGSLAEAFDGDATVGAGHSMTFHAGWALGSAGDLTLSGGGSTATVSGDSDVYGTVDVNGTGRFLNDQSFHSSADVQVTNPSDKLILTGDTAYFAGPFSGSGTVEQTGDVTVIGNTTLTIGTYDWDGSSGMFHQTLVQPGNTFAINAGGIEAAPDDGYDGTVTVSNAATLSVSTPGPWRLDGELVLAGGTVSGSEIDNRGTVSGHGVISAGGIVNDGTLAADGGTLTIDTAANPDLDGAWGAGVVDAVAGDIVVQSALAGAFDGDMTVGPGHSITLNGGWSLGPGGTLVLNGPISPARILGGPMHAYGQITATGLAARIASSSLFLHAGASVSVPDPSDVLALDAAITYNGGSCIGSGQIHQLGDASVVAPTTIGVATYDWDGAEDSSTTVQPGASFTINADSIDPGDGAYDGTVIVGSGATLTVNTPGSWVLEGTVQLDGGMVTGSAIQNDGTIKRYGQVTAAGLVNNGALRAGGGTLVIDTASFPDLDGAAGTGELDAGSGDLHVKGDYGGLFAFYGTLTAAGGHEYRMDYHGLANYGSMTLNGASYVAPLLDQRSTLHVGRSASTLATAASFSPGSTTTLDTDLRIVGSARVYFGATFTGVGSLIIEAGSLLRGEGTVGVHVINKGVAQPGSSAGELTVAGYTQTATGALDIEIGGYNAGTDVDHLIVTGAAALDGELAVSLVRGFEPQYADEFEVLTCSSRSGMFAAVTGPGLGGDWQWNVIYGDTHATLLVAIPGDATLGGCVDGADYTAWADNYNQSGEWKDGDFSGDGFVDGADYTAWADHYHAGCGLGGDSVPEPATLLLTAAAGLALALRRKR